MAHDDDELRRVTRALLEIAGALEAVDDADERVRRTLELTRELVPYARCALLDAPPGRAPRIIAVPDPDPRERARLLAVLERVLHLVGNDDEIGRSAGGSRHLTLPIIGLDQVIGIVRVEPPEAVAYDALHLRLLSVVAAQLGAYLTLVRLRDDTERHARELAEANELQERLVGIVSHDLRSPLSVIVTMADLLLEDADATQKPIVERALRSARRASRIIDDLLDVTHVRVSGTLSVAPQRIDLRQLLREIVDDARLAHPGRKIDQIEVGRARSAHGEWDPDRLAQALTNLLNNALHHGDRGSPVRVRLSLHEHDDDVAVAVENRGPPIAEALLPSIFDPFTRGGAATAVASRSLGLGLYIVDQIARAHGGSVIARSSEREGTSFTIRLPRSRAPARAARRDDGARDGERAEAGATKAPGTILVVDDDPSVTRGLAALLERRDYRVATASDGEEALALLRTGLRPRLILLDLLMPVMDGEAFARTCRADPALASIPIVIISAFTAEAVKLARAVESEYLPKPFPIETLLDTMKRVSA